jgi:hypothetical protein
MADPAAILQSLYAAGFELQPLERYPKAICVSRGDCIALLVPAADGLQVLGAPGWKFGDNVGVLTASEGKQVFQYKEEKLAATPERLAQLQAFAAELRELLAVKNS